VEKIVKHDSWPIQTDILNPPLLWLTSRKPLWLDLQPVDFKSWWRHNWKSTQVVNCHLVCDPTIRQPGFNRQQWSLLNRFRTDQGHCSACRRKWRLTDTDLCPCGETQTMSHIVEFCPWQNWMAAYLGYTLRMKTLFRGWSWHAYVKKNVVRKRHSVKTEFTVCCNKRRWVGSRLLSHYKNTRIR